MPSATGLVLKGAMHTCSLSRKVRHKKLYVSKGLLAGTYKYFPCCPDALLEIVGEFMMELERRFGEHVHVIDWALHLDEATY